MTRPNWRPGRIAVRFASSSESETKRPIRLGLRQNWEQFALLVIVNMFVGGMIGLERTVVPLLAEEDFGRASTTVALSFIVAFGIVKAFSNLVPGAFPIELDGSRS